MTWSKDKMLMLYMAAKKRRDSENRKAEADDIGNDYYAGYDRGEDDYDADDDSFGGDDDDDDD